MSFKTADRTRETSTTEGTGTYSLAGAVAGFRTFVAGIGTGNQCTYSASDGTDWETGLGTVTDGDPDTLTRDVIFQSSNSNSPVDWAAGDKKIVLCELPARSDRLNLLDEQSIVPETFPSSLEFTSPWFSSDYDEYVVEWFDLLGFGGRLRLRMSTDGGSSWDTGSNYSYIATNSTSGAAIFTSMTASGSNDHIHISWLGSDAEAYASGHIRLLNLPSTTSYKHVEAHSQLQHAFLGPADYGSYASGLYKSTSAVNALQFIFTASAVTGTFRLYGIRPT